MSLNHDEAPEFVSRQVMEAERFYLELNPPPGPKLTVVCGGWERCAPDYRIDRKEFPFYCVEMVTAGKGVLTLGEKEYSLNPGVVFTYGPGIAHSIVTDKNERLEKSFVDFSGQGGLDLMNHTGLLPGSYRVLSEPSGAEVTWSNMIQLGGLTQPNTQRIVTLMLEVLLLQIADATAFEQGQEQSHQTFLKCRRWIDEHYQEVTTAEEVAEVCNINPAYLSRLFIRYGKESPYRYLTRKKMMQAANLLDAGGLIVREVAERLGMDAFHFSRVFKRVHGIPPSDFIRARKK